MYRTIVGIYMLLACMPFRERQRRANVFPLTLTPHGSNLREVLSSFSELTELDAGIHVTINGIDTYIVAFALAYIGDIVQQQWNAGCLGPRAKLSCRNCYVSNDANERGNVSYDIIHNGRYHYQMRYLRQEMAALPERMQAQFAKRQGMTLGLSTFIHSDGFD